MQAELRKTFHFDAGHHLLHVGPEHKCARPHGHGYTVTVCITGPIDSQVGWVMDFAQIKRVVGPLIEQFDHADLNQVQGLANTTSECIAVWLWERIKPHLSELSAVEVSETAGACCIYRGT